MKNFNASKKILFGTIAGFIIFELVYYLTLSAASRYGTVCFTAISHCGIMLHTVSLLLLVCAVIASAARLRWLMYTACGIEIVFALLSFFLPSVFPEGISDEIAITFSRYCGILIILMVPVAFALSFPVRKRSFVFLMIITGVTALLSVASVCLLAFVFYWGTLSFSMCVIVHPVAMLLPLMSWYKEPESGKA